jgi:hypothetical protein
MAFVYRGKLSGLERQERKWKSRRINRMHTTELKQCGLITSSDFAHIRGKKRRREERMKTPEDVEGDHSYERLVLMAGNAAAFAGIATSEAVLRNEERMVSRDWGRHTVAGAQHLAKKLRPQGLGALGKLGLAMGSANQSNDRSEPPKKVELNKAMCIQLYVGVYTLARGNIYRS